MDSAKNEVKQSFCSDSYDRVSTRTGDKDFHDEKLERDLAAMQEHDHTQLERVISLNPFQCVRVEKPRILTLNKKSIAFIISNRFEKHKNGKLIGNIKDEQYIRDTFQWLNFEVSTYVENTALEMWELVEELSRMDYSDFDCVACFILTHGDKYRQIYGIDGSPISIDSVVRKFVNCVTLFGKPKLFFIQTCRGSGFMPAVMASDNSVKSAGSKIEKAKDADTLVYFPTTQGNASFGNKNDGSYFMACLCKVLQEYGGEHSLDDVILKVNEILSVSHLGYSKVGEGYIRSVEVGEVTHTMTYKIFFKPTGNYVDFVDS